MIVVAVTVTGEIPVDVRVIVCVAAEFTDVLSKISAVALKLSSASAAAVAVPLRPMNVLLFLLPQPMAIRPVVLPFEVGANCTFSARGCPG